MTSRRFTCRRKPRRIKHVIFEDGHRRTVYRSRCLPLRPLRENHDVVPTAVQSTSSAMQPSVSEDQKPEQMVTVTSYEEKRQKLSQAWESIRHDLVDVRIEEMSPATFICQKCGQQDDEIIRCLDCSATAYYCFKCNEDLHATILFHVPNIWKGTMFIPLTVRQKQVIRRCDHSCAFSYTRELCVIDIKGFQHRIGMQFCSCEKEALTLLRYGFWPATPDSPKVAFDLDFMELATVLQLESHLAIKSFCEALGYMNRFRIHDVKEVTDIYRAVVGDSSHEYRYHRTALSSGKHLDCGLDSGTCPACCKNKGRMVICMDANFGLVHKKAVSTQTMSVARHVSDPFFHSQEDVDRFVASYQDSKKSEDCATFQAGSAVRSKVKNSKLDITGVFGSVCKHDHPLKMCNLRHGERLAYSVHHLEAHLNENGDQQVIAMYDIACVLHKHLLKNNRSDLVEKTLFAVPVFHSFAHNMPCQLLYGQRHVERTGLTDGEGVERLWSFLRSFSKMSKEMTLGNRHDLLVDALYHYSRKLNQKLSDRLVTRYNKACIQKESALAAIQNLHQKSLSELAELYEARRSSVRLKGSSKDVVTITLEEEYSWVILQTENTLRQLEIDNESEEAKSQLTKELAKNESQLLKFEKKGKINERWISSQARTMECLESYKKKRKQLLVKQIRDQCIERQYLLSLIKKYPDGQDIVTRLGKQLRTVTAKLKCYLTEINSLSDNEYTFKEISDLSSDFHCERNEAFQDDNEILNLYVSLSRAEEEMEFLKEDMSSFIYWIREQLQILDDRLSVMDFGSTESRKAKGEKTLLLFFKMEFESKHKDAIASFSKYVEEDFGVPETAVMDYVLTCLRLKHFREAIPEDDVSETLEAVSAYESEQTDEQETDYDSDEES